MKLVQIDSGIMTAPIDSRERAKDLVERVPQEFLSQAIDFLESLCQMAAQNEVSASGETQENTLLQIIQRRLSLEEQIRLNYLRQRNEAENITPAEHQELLAYVERVEQQDVERVAALIQLAQIRRVDLPTLVKQFLPTHYPLTNAN